MTASAQDIRNRLLRAEGQDKEPNQWSIFILLVIEILPTLIQKGRPSLKTIQGCFIGQLGFNSWNDMLVAPKEDNGLGLTKSRWEEWKRAWSAISEYPDLHHAPITAAEVNRIKRDCKTYGFEFPENLEQFRQVENEIKQKKIEQRAERKSTANSGIAELRQQIELSNELVSKLQQQTLANKAQIQSLRRVISVIMICGLFVFMYFMYK